MFSFLVASVLLNDSSFSAQSGNPKPMASTNVQMVSADIKVKIPSCEVMVTYQFHNTTNKATTVTMAFPEEGYDASLENKKTWFKCFKSWIDGVETEVIAKRVDDKDYDPDFGYKVWWVKDVPFKANQSRIVANTYVSQPGSSAMPDKFFAYIVHTAKNWKGNVKKLRLELDVSGLPKGKHFAVQSKPNKITGNKLAWFWENFEPSTQNDLFVQWPHPEFEYPNDINWFEFFQNPVYVVQ
ncbi:MAG: DUF4424 family protein [Fimbriimonadaceae bacterium]|nr:DUF4424 family protein [Fimbriimonadaceae bacterium]